MQGEGSFSLLILLMVNHFSLSLNVELLTDPEGVDLGP
jgi:hypothetical protein